MEPEPEPEPAQWVAEDLRKAERARTEELLRSSEALERRTSADAAELEAVRQELASVRSATRPLNPFDGVPDECVARICRFLPGERELGRLARTSSRFGLAAAVADPRDGAPRNAPCVAIVLNELYSRVASLLPDAPQNRRPWRADEPLGATLRALWEAGEADPAVDIPRPVGSDDEMGLSEPLLRKLRVWDSRASATSKRAVKPLVAGRDTILAAKDGQALCIGALQAVRVEDRRPQVIVLAPPGEFLREPSLILQRKMLELGEFVRDLECHAFCNNNKPGSTTSASEDIERLERGVHIAIGYPGDSSHRR